MQPPGDQAIQFAVAASKLQPLLTLAEDAGIRPAGLLAAAGLHAALLDDLDQRSIALADYFRVLEQVADAAHDETWKLSTRPLLPGATTFALSHLSACRTLNEAMRRIAQAYNHLHGGAYNRVELKEDQLVYIIDDRDFPYAMPSDPAHIQFTMECVLIFLHSMLSLIASDDTALRVIKVHTRRARHSAEAHCLQFWDAPVRWESDSYALCYPVEAATSPVVLPYGEPPTLRSIYRRAVELIEARQRTTPAVPDTTEQVIEAIQQGLAEQRGVAARLKISVATLRRRLKDEGTSFRELRRQTLNASAKSMLEQRRHIADIADALGFSDFRSFNRAFKSWNGMTPGSYALQYRQQRR